MFRVWFLAGLITLYPAVGVLADLGPLDSLVMPGKVIKGHERLEQECKQCHVPFRRDAQRDLCLGCHDHRDVAEDVARHRGFHGRLEDSTCSQCHTEHKGREADIVKLDERRFDHSMTDFALKGAHANPALACRDCHKAGRKHRAAPTDCYACHRKDDAHKGGLGKDCRSCHTENRWTEVRFDHSKTGWPLDGRHVDVECKACHVNERYQNTAKTCVGCHRKDDDKKGHKGRFGAKCETCHVADGWRQLTFDHDRDTKYRLIGRHRDAKCTACHTGDLYKQKLERACVGCHRKDDDKKGHQGRFGSRCENCHVERDWKAIVFDHDRATTYRLLGKHRSAKCTACHTGTLYQEKLATTCYACHKKDDKHKGQQGQRCEQCHDERSWKTTRFDHDLTRFPLLGRHAKAECKACHRAATFKDASTKCVDCHQKEDAHKRTLGPACEACHNARDWKQWRFDHDARTRFKLDGGHRGLACASCHQRPMKDRVEAPSACVACHDADDVHAGAYGRYCERCHVTSTFDEIKADARTRRR